MAISALLISFSMLRIYCTSWLESVPDFCFPDEAASPSPSPTSSVPIVPTLSPGGPLYSCNSSSGSGSGGNTFYRIQLDLDRCITAFERIPTLRGGRDSQPSSVSPTSISDLCEVSHSEVVAEDAKRKTLC